MPKAAGKIPEVLAVSASHTVHGPLLIETKISKLAMPDPTSDPVHETTRLVVGVLGGRAKIELIGGVWSKVLVTTHANT